MTQSPVLEPTAALERARRLLPIAADLLPAEIVESRRARKVRRSVLVGIIALVVVLTAWYGYAVYQTSVARGALSGAQADATRLQRKQDQYAPLVKIQGDAASIRAQLNQLMASDLAWSSLLGPAVTGAPAGVQVDQISANLATPNKAAANAVTLPNSTTHQVIGQFTVSGIAPNKDAIATYVDTLAHIPGLGNPYVSSAVPGEQGVAFTVQLDMTDAVLGGRFSKTKTK